MDTNMSRLDRSLHALLIAPVAVVIGILVGPWPSDQSSSMQFPRSCWRPAQPATARSTRPDICMTGGSQLQPR